MRLAGTDETIPTLAETLALVGHRAMVHIELKTPYGEVGPLEQRVHEVLIDHNGPTCVIGFNPYSHAWFAEHHPRRPARPGQLLLPRRRRAHIWRRSSARPSRGWSTSRIARPHFLALGLDMLPSARADELRAKGMPIVAWTVRDPDAVGRGQGRTATT